MNTVPAKIKIESYIENLDSRGLVEGDGERSVSCPRGKYGYLDGKAIISYGEESEGGRIESEVQLLGETVRVKRSGAIESIFVFREGECTHSLYKIPPYSFETEIKTRRIRVSLDERGGTLELFYNMKIGGTDKNARMKIWIQTD